MNWKDFLKPNKTKIVLSIILSMLSFFIIYCYPIEGSVEHILKTRPYCEIIRGDNLLARLFTRLVGLGLLFPFSLIIYFPGLFVYLFSYILVEQFIAKIPGNLEVNSTWIIYFATFFELLYIFFISYLILCLFESVIIKIKK